MRNERGLTLIATLWIITILTLLAAQFLYSIRLERGIQANLEERIKMDYTARAGVEAFISQLKNDETAYDSLDEEWAQTIEGELPDAMRPEQTLRFQAEVTDELARINLNEADENMISQLLTRAGADETMVQMLAQTVIQTRDEKAFRTVGDLARVEGMTDDLLYGAATAGTQQQEEDVQAEEQEQQPVPLVDSLTVFSLDSNTDAEGNARVNISSADENALSQIQNAEGTQLFTQGEAQAIIAQREQEAFNTIGDLLQAPAVSQQALDNARDRLSTNDDEENRVNINSASQQDLEGVFDDAGVAQDIIRYRDSNGQYGSVDDIRQAPVMTTDEMAGFADKLTTVDGTTVPGLININTAPQEILELLPSMDATKAQAIINRRQVSENQNTGSSGGNSGGQENSTGPFENVGQLLQVEGIDEDTFRELVGRVTYRSQVFKVKSSGIASDDKAIATCVTVLDRSEQTVQFRYWRQD